MTTEWRFIAAFADHFRRCQLVAGETVAILSESQSRPVLVETARLAAQSLGGRVFDVVVPTPPSAHAVPIRSTGASQAIAHHPAVIAALAAAQLVVDCTVEGLLHSPELGGILGGGARVLMISNEHPEVLERIGWDDDMPRRVQLGFQLISAAGLMHVTSAAGTDLTVQLAGASAAGSTGVTSGAGSIAHWPGGLVAAFPAAHSVNGTVVLAPGDMNLTFNTLIQSPVTLHIADDHGPAGQPDPVCRHLRDLLGHRDQRHGQVTQFRLLRPDQSVFQQWSFDSQSVGGTAAHYAASYWYFTRTIPAAGPQGTWTFEATFEGQVSTHAFQVIDGNLADGFENCLLYTSPSPRD